MAESTAATCATAVNTASNASKTIGMLITSCNSQTMNIITILLQTH